MGIVITVLGYCWQAVVATCIQIIILMGLALVLAFIMNHIAGFVKRQAYQLMGRNLYLGLFGWLGTAVHELGHALFCVIFRHRIVEIQFFKPDSKTGTLGYVKHSYNPHSIYQNIGDFFIGIGPIIIGAISIFLLSIYLLGLDILGTDITLNAVDFGSWHGFKDLAQNIWESMTNVLDEIFSGDNLTSWKFYLFIYLVFCIGSSITLSHADIRGARKGLILIIAIMLCFNLLTIWAGDFATDFCIDLSSSCGAIYAIMLFTLLFNLIFAGIMLILAIPSGTNRKLFK